MRKNFYFNIKSGNDFFTRDGSLSSSGVTGIEFIIAVILFLSAFWFIYLQSMTMLSQKLQLRDVRQASAELYSSLIINEAGKPENWTYLEQMQELGFAYYDNKTRPNILDSRKLDAVLDIPCPDTTHPTFSNINFAVEVKTKEKTWKWFGPDRVAYYYNGKNKMKVPMEELDAVVYHPANEDTLLSEIKNYDFVLIEDPAGKLAPSKLPLLEEYVYKGGFLFITSQALPSSGPMFGVNFKKRPHGSGSVTVLKNDTHLGYIEGQTFTPNDAHYVTGNIVKIAEFSDGKAAIAKWSYGKGIVYFFSDTKVTGYPGDYQRDMLKKIRECKYTAPPPGVAMIMRSAYVYYNDTEEYHSGIARIWVW